MAFDFPNAPTLNQVYVAPTGSTYTWDGEKWAGGPASVGAVLYSTPQGLTSAQASQARANIWVTKKNYIINGGMMVSQENGTTAGASSQYYPVDTFVQVSVSGGTTTTQQVASPTPGGSPNRIRMTATTLDASPGATYIWAIRTAVEGLRAADLRSGSVSAKTITIQFGCKAPAGTYHVAIQNAAQTRSYPASYVIAAGEANTDVIKSVTLTLDTTGTWAADNTAGMYLWWTLECGSNRTGVANTWQAGEIACGPGQFNVMSTAGNVFELFDVSLTEGNVAPPFQVPDYASELLACQRYYQKWFNHMYGGWYSTSAAGVYQSTIISPPMCKAPTASFANVTYAAASSLTANSCTTNRILANFTTGSAAISYALADTILNARL